MLVDIYNGDADGIFALHQYRLAFPAEQVRRITGIKRDIRLLTQVVEISDAEITVCEISLDANRAPLDLLLDQHNRITYFDHHYAGTLPETENLTAHINCSPDTCTSLLVNQELQGNYNLWAICGAFGDNLHAAATQFANQLGLNEDETGQLRELGELFNYNGYGECIEDLHFHPEELYRAVQPFDNPFTFIEQSDELSILRDGHQQDMQKAEGLKPEPGPSPHRVFFLPNAPWARRISGVFSNLKAREKTTSAHAVIGRNMDESLRISVRAPLENKTGADTLCRKYPTGGGRAAAAGINSLPEEMLDNFLEEFHSTFS